MDYKLVSYMGIDALDDYNYRWVRPYKLEGSFVVSDNIKDLLSFMVNKSCINYKVINTFDCSNYNNDDFFGNIIILNNKFDFNFEYCSTENSSLINALNQSVYNTTFVSLENFNFQNLDINICITDLFCSNIDKNEIFYSLNMLIYINEL